jgi:hypothetical protein
VLHVGKTGGSAVKEGIRGPIRGVHSTYDGVAPGTRIIVHPHGIDLATVPARDDVVFFLRDPVDRYVSGFNSRLREARPRFLIPWSEAERVAFTRFPTPDALATAIGSDDPETRDAARRAMRAIRHVRTRLADWLGDPSLLERRRSHIIFVGWCETLDQDFERLKAQLRLPEDRRLPDDPAKAHRAPDGQDRSLSPGGIANLRSWYRTDYELIWACQALGLTELPVGVATRLD